MKKLMIVGLLLLGGCSLVPAPNAPSIVIVDNSLQPAQIVDTTPILVRYIDPTTGKEVSVKENRAGDYILTPSTYKRLLNTAMGEPGTNTPGNPAIPAPITPSK